MAQCVLALLLIGTMSTAASLLFNSIMSQNSDAPQINVSGRQRMLSQRTSLYADRLIVAETDSERTNVLTSLNSAISLMETSHQALIHGDQELGISANMEANLHEHYFGEVGLDQRVRDFIASARSLTKEPKERLTASNPYLVSISTAASRDLLGDLDAAVKLYEQNGIARTTLLGRAELFVWLATLALLFAVGIFIFRPMVYRIESQFEENIVANLELVEKDRRIRLLLDSTGDGLLPIDLDGRVQPGASSKVGDWFGDVAAGELFWDAIADDADESLAMQLGFEQIVSDFLPFDVAVSQAVTSVHRGGQVLGIDYRELHDDGQRTGFLLVFRDITSDLAREKSEAETREFSKVLSNAMQDQHSFSRFVAETRDSLAEAASTETSEDGAARLLHTIKGNTSIFGFHQFSKQVHLAEESLLSGEAASRVIPTLSEAWDRRVEQFHELIDRQEDVRISRREHQLHIDHLEQAECGIDLVCEVRRWSFESARRNLEQIAKGAERLAHRLNKKVEVQLDVEDGLRLDAEHFGGVFSSLIHIVRNSLDHGIESAEERRAVGKPIVGQLNLRCRVENNFVKISVSDDGGGVDWDKIRDKAANMGLSTDSPESLVDALFSDGLSSRDYATEISGRGVGMSAIKETVERQNGSVSVKSESGLGTRITLSMPLPSDCAYADLIQGELCETGDS